MKVSASRVLAAFVFAGALAVMACQAQPSAFAAHSPDGQFEVSVSRATVEDAFREMCSAPGPLPCDGMEKYRVRLVVDRTVTGVDFVHRDVGAGEGGEIAVLPAFSCGYDGRRAQCGIGGATGW